MGEGRKLNGHPLTNFSDVWVSTHQVMAMLHVIGFVERTGKRRFPSCGVVGEGQYGRAQRQRNRENFEGRTGKNLEEV